MDLVALGNEFHVCSSSQHSRGSSGLSCDLRSALLECYERGIDLVYIQVGRFTLVLVYSSSFYGDNDVYHN